MNITRSEKNVIKELRLQKYLTIARNIQLPNYQDKWTYSRNYYTRKLPQDS